MTTAATKDLSQEHKEFYERFRSFWARPSGARVAEIIAPHAVVHFSGQGTFSGAEYVDVMAGLLETMEDLEVTPIDCAGSGDLLYIYWNSSARIDGAKTEWLGVDRFHIVDRMAVEEHVIFDSASLVSHR
ncbi:MAG: nuclear transport factor 2 family protein [Pseudomonadota bacterium]